MNYPEQEKSKVFRLIDIIEYIPHTVVVKTILKKATGDVTLASFDTGESYKEQTSPFDIFIQVVDGIGEVVIEKDSHSLESGQAIIIRAHTPNTIKARERFTMISTIIKSGYENMLS